MNTRASLDRFGFVAQVNGGEDLGEDGGVADREDDPGHDEAYEHRREPGLASLHSRQEPVDVGPPG